MTAEQPFGATDGRVRFVRVEPGPPVGYADSEGQPVSTAVLVRNGTEIGVPFHDRGQEYDHCDASAFLSVPLESAAHRYRYGYGEEGAVAYHRDTDPDGEFAALEAAKRAVSASARPVSGPRARRLARQVADYYNAVADYDDRVADLTSIDVPHFLGERTPRPRPLARRPRLRTGMGRGERRTRDPRRSPRHDAGGQVHVDGRIGLRHPRRARRRPVPVTAAPGRGAPGC